MYVDWYLFVFEGYWYLFVGFGVFGVMVGCFVFGVVILIDLGVGDFGFLCGV